MHDSVHAPRTKSLMCQLVFAEASSSTPRMFRRRMQGRQKRGQASVLEPAHSLPSTLRPRSDYSRRFSFLLLGASLLLPSILASECIVTDECRICTSSDKDQIEQCAETGKVEYVTCAPAQQSNDDDAQSKWIVEVLACPGYRVLSKA